MAAQLSLFDNELKSGSGTGVRVSLDYGKQLRDRGISRAVEHAEEVEEGWQAKALAFMRTYAETHHLFSGEMVRIESRGVVSEPAHLRAWGAVLVGAAKRGWIKEAGFVKVSNPKAHKTPATLWESLLFKGVKP